MSRSAGALLLVVVLAGPSGCKLAEREEQSDRALPTPEPAASTPPSRPTELPSPPRAREVERSPARPATPASDSPTRPASTTEPTTTAEPTAAAPTGTAAPTAPATGAAGAPVALNASCLPKCQASLQSCISRPPALDGGLPSLESLAECRKSFDDCKQGCGL